jgi:hypothetical protein
MESRFFYQFRCYCKFKSDDEAPYYNAASNSLIFACNGRVGMGGFDLFESKGSFPSSFSTPVNLGHPVNSVKDDIYFVTKVQ